MLYRKMFSIFVLLLLIFTLFLFISTSTKSSKQELAIDIHHMIKQMFPESEIEFLPENRVIVSPDKEHRMEYRIDKILFAEYIDEEELLLVLRIPEEKTSHSGGFYNITLAVFDMSDKLISPIKNFAADEGELVLFEGSSKTYLMFVGNTTYQGYTEYTGGLYNITRKEWERIYPQNESYWQNKKVIIGNKGLLLFQRVFEREGTETIPKSHFVFEKELFWNSKKDQFVEQYSSKYFFRERNTWE